MDVKIKATLCPDPQYMYWSSWKDRKVEIQPAMEGSCWFVRMIDLDGERKSFIDPVHDSGIAEQLYKLEYLVHSMVWCMEPCSAFGYNPFLSTETILRGHTHVYIAHDLRKDQIKIGSTKQLRSRLRQLFGRRQGNFNLLGIMQGTNSLEYYLHGLFNAHLASGREWFYPHDDILEYVSENALNVDNEVHLWWR